MSAKLEKLFEGHVCFSGDIENNTTAPLPRGKGVVLFTDKFDRPIQLLICGDIRRRVKNRLFEAGEDESSIPITWLLIDEAHVLVPQTKKTAASDPLIEYAKQGRKPGCALVLVTQQPAAMHKDIMSQIDLMITHLLTFEDDIKAFLKRVPSSVPDDFEESDFIRSMPTGVSLFSDQHTQNRSFVVKVRPRVSLHAGREAVPKSLRAKMRDTKQVSSPSLDKRDVVVESIVAEPERRRDDEKLIPEPIPDMPKERKEPSKPVKVKKKSDYPIPEPLKMPEKMVLSILERKLEYGQNLFLFDGSKSTRFDKHQRSGFKDESIDELIPNIVAELERIGWEIHSIIPENTFVIILMKLDSATLGIAYTIYKDKTALSYLVVAKERFKKSTYDKIFQLK